MSMTDSFWVVVPFGVVAALGGIPILIFGIYQMRRWVGGQCNDGICGEVDLESGTQPEKRDCGNNLDSPLPVRDLKGDSEDTLVGAEGDSSARSALQKS